MNAYVMQDLIEQQRWQEHQEKIQKEDWINSRGDELLREYPDNAYQFANCNLPTEISSGLYTSKGHEAYIEFITALAWQRAEIEWEEKFGWLVQP